MKTIILVALALGGCTAPGPYTPINTYYYDPFLAQQQQINTARRATEAAQTQQSLEQIEWNQNFARSQLLLGR